MKKIKDKKIYWIVGIAVVALIILTQTNLFKKQEEGPVGLKVHYYYQGQEVFPPKENFFSKLFSFSIIIPSAVQVADQISFEINVSNTANVAINNTIVGAYPNELYTALSSIPPFKLNPGEDIILKSNNISTLILETYEQPINFTINVSGVPSFPAGAYEKVYSLGFLGLGVISPNKCYQETPNLVNTADGTCSLVYTGKVITGGTNGYRAVDGDWATYSYGGTSGTVYYFNYTKPTGATGALWKTKDGIGDVLLRVPDSCFNYNSTSIALRAISVMSGSTPHWACGDLNPGVTSRSPCYSVIWSCYKGGTYAGNTNVESWVLLKNSANWNSTRYSSYGYLYEEGMYWNLP